MLRLLFAAGADVEARNRQGATTLMYAARYRSQNRLGGPIFADLTSTLELLIEAGADVNARHSLGATALMAAVASGLPSHVELLLDAGADPNVSIEVGETMSLLDLALYHDNPEIVEMIRHTQEKSAHPRD